MEDDISGKINTLNELITEIDECDELFSKMIENKNEELEYNKLMEDIPPRERIDLNWDMSYTTYTLYYIYLKLLNKDPKDHDIKDEMKRVQEYYAKINELDVTAMPSVINKEAAQRFISNAISNSNKTRKLKGSAPLPEAVHLNWDKNIK